MTSLAIIILTLKTTVINNLTLTNTFYLLRFAYSKTLKTEEKMGNKQTVGEMVKNPCKNCGGYNCFETDEGQVYCNNTNSSCE